MTLEPWHWNPSWNVTWGELYFAMSGEQGLEAEVWEYDQTPPDKRDPWPDEHQMLGWRICLREIDQHAIAGTLPEFRERTRNAMGIREVPDAGADLFRLVEIPWIEEYFNMKKLLDGPDTPDKRTALVRATSALGYVPPKEGKLTTLSSFAIHPREKMEVVEGLPRYRRQRGRPGVSVPWGSIDMVAAMDSVRLKIATGMSVTEACRFYTTEIEMNFSENRPKDLAKLYRQKMSLRGNASEGIAGE